MGDSLIASRRAPLHPKALIAMGCVMLGFQGGVFYNSVAFDGLVKSDVGMTKIIEDNPMIVTNGIAYFLIGDIIGGAALNPIMDVVGPRYFAMLGSLVNLVAYGLLGFAPRDMVEYWMSPTMLLIGLALQLVVNPTLFLGNGLGKESSVLLFLIMGASCECGLIICSIWQWSGISLQAGCVAYLVIAVLFAIFAYFCYHDTYEGFNLPAPRRDSLCSSSGALVEDVYHRAEANPSRDVWGKDGDYKYRKRTMDSFFDEHYEESFVKDTRPAMQIITESWFIRMTVAYTILFFVFQCETTYWSSGTQMFPRLHKLFYIGTSTSIFFGISTGFIGKRWSAVNVAKYYCFACSIVAFALAWQNELGLGFCTFLYFTFKASLFTIWFSLMNAQYTGNDNLGFFFAVPQFLSSLFFWVFNMQYGREMAAVPNTGSRIVWIILGAVMSIGFSLVFGLKSRK